jgi:hypothetical protein
VREVIRAHPERFEVFERGFPTVGPKTLWVRLRRTGRSEERTSSTPFPK